MGKSCSKAGCWRKGVAKPSGEAAPKPSGSAFLQAAVRSQLAGIDEEDSEDSDEGAGDDAQPSRLEVGAQQFQKGGQHVLENHELDAESPRPPENGHACQDANTSGASLLLSADDVPSPPAVPDHELVMPSDEPPEDVPMSLRSAAVASMEKDSMSLRPLAAMLSLSPPSTAGSVVSSGRRLTEWDRSSDRNLCHVFKYCEEFGTTGFLRRQPDSGRFRGVDWIVGKAQVKEEQSRTRDKRRMTRVSSCADGMGVQNLELLRAEQVLRRCSFFLDLEAQAPGLLHDLAAVVMFVQEAEGQMVLRQGDTGDQMYAISKGEVGVHLLSKSLLRKVHSPPPSVYRGLRTLTEARGVPSYSPAKVEVKEDSPKVDSPKESREGRRKSLSGSDGGPTPSEVDSPKQTSPKEPGERRMSFGIAEEDQLSPNSPGSPKQEDQETAQEEQIRYLTSERRSTWTVQSEIGKRVTTLRAGNVFGEKALVNEKDRAATVTCLTECEFVRVDFESYQTVLRDRVSKATFFRENLPEACVSAGSEACFYFKLLTLPKGHILLDEGIAGEPRIYLINKGSVKFFRSEVVDEDVGKEYSKLSVSYAKTKRTTRKASGTLQYDHLSDGGMFCSLAAFPIDKAFEPFTAVVDSDECEMYYTTMSLFSKMPEDMLKPMRHHMMHGLAIRLMRLRDRYPEAFMPPLPPMDEEDQRREVARKERVKLATRGTTQRRRQARAPGQAIDTTWFPRAHGPQLDYHPTMLE